MKDAQDWYEMIKETDVTNTKKVAALVRKIQADVLQDLVKQIKLKSELLIREPEQK